MKLKYHNKLEIEVGDRTYVAYNKVLRSLYSKMCNFESFANYFAFGKGKTEIADTDTKLGDWFMCRPATTTQVSCNPESGVYYVKKVATFDSSYETAFTFTEVGIAADNSFNPDIYNHIFITDENGEIIEVVRNLGESLTIKLTIFLDITAAQNTFLTSGENNLIKALLGESVGDTTIYAVRGTNTTENKQMSRVLPTNYDKRYKATILTNELESGEIELNIVAKLEAGEAREVVFIMDNSVIARLNIMGEREFGSTEEVLTSSKNNTILVQDNVQSITEILDENNVSVTDYSVKNVGVDFGDEITHDEFFGVNSNTPIWLSLEGDKVAFLTQSKLTILREEDYGLKLIQTGAISVDGIEHVALTGNYVVVFRNLSPYIEIYKIESNVCKRKNFYKANYDESSYSYDYSSVGVIERNDGALVIGAILAESCIGIALTVIEDEDGYNLTKISQSELSKVDKILTIRKTQNNEAKIIFLTSSMNNPVTPYAMDIFSYDFSGKCNYSQTETFMTAKSISVCGKYLIVNINESPYVYLYETEDFNRVAIDTQTLQGNINGSTDLSYVYGLWGDGLYHFYYILDSETLFEIDSSYINNMITDSIVKILPMSRMLLIITENEENPYRVILFDEKYTLISNLPESSSDYTVNYNKYNLLGSGEFEGVQVILSFLF